MNTIFIGYDAREQDAARVADYSLKSRATSRCQTYFLEHRMLRRIGLFDRPWEIDGSGQYKDKRDKRPFSTEFSHTRFLAFWLGYKLGLKGPCMFVDCDWLFLSDISELMEQQAENPDKIGVVNRERKVEENSLKMDGMVQQNYDRKLWSAMFTFMPVKHWAEIFRPSEVCHLPGRELHAFKQMPKDQFWDIDPAWHFIPSLDERPDEVKGVHFSEFSPWLNPDKRPEAPAEFDAWEYELERTFKSAIHSGMMRDDDTLDKALRAGVSA